jgi:hypothetical protein
VTLAKRKRYFVKIEGNGEIKQIVIIAYDLEGMYREVYRLYGYLLKDVNGGYMGNNISYEETTIE